MTKSEAELRMSPRRSRSEPIEIINDGVLSRIYESYVLKRMQIFLLLPDLVVSSNVVVIYPLLLFLVYEND